VHHTHIVRWRIFLQTVLIGRLVGWSVGHESVLPLNAWMDFDQIWWTDGPWDRDDLIKFL